MNYKYIAEELILESMKQNIAEFGSTKVFSIIEDNFYKAKTRLRYRKYFLLAGGIAPESEIKL